MSMMGSRISRWTNLDLKYCPESRVFASQSQAIHFQWLRTSDSQRPVLVVLETLHNHDDQQFLYQALRPALSQSQLPKFQLMGRGRVGMSRHVCSFQTRLVCIHMVDGKDRSTGRVRLWHFRGHVLSYRWLS